MRSMPDRSDAWSPDDARQILEAWRRTGESLAAFGRRHGYAAARLYWWRKRLASAPVELTTLSLVPATVTSEATSPITIRLPSAIVVEATSATPAWIAAVVAELTRSS